MTRKEFFKLLGLTALMSVLSNPMSEARESVTIYRCYLRGLQYYSAADIFQRLKLGKDLKLVAEPNNKFDKYAVEVFFQNYKLGYLPRGENKTIARMLHQGIKLSAKITDLEDNSKYHYMDIGVTVEMPKSQLQQDG